MATGLTESLRETLSLFKESGPPQTTPEVADELGLGRRSTYDRLERLVEHGALETKKVGANARVWWRPPTEATGGASASSTRRVSDRPIAMKSLVDDVLNEAEAGIFVLDENFDVVWLNATTEQYFGLDREQAVGRDKRELIEEHITSVVDDSSRFAETVLRTYDDNTYVEEFECRVTRGDDREERWLKHRSSPITTGQYAGGRVELYYDITERKRSEQTRREFESLVNAVEEYAIFVLDTDGYVRTWNPGAEQIKGYGADEILGEHISIFYTDADREAGLPEENLAQAAKQGSVEDEGWRVRADDSTFWANVTLTAIRDEDGDLEGYAKVTRDMTEKREREQELRETNAFIESVLDAQQDALYTFDAEGTFLRWNDEFREVTGYTDAEIAEMQPLDFIADETAETAVTAISRVFRDGESVTVEIAVETKAGEKIPYEVTGSPLTDQDGTVTGLTGVGRDITERKARERRLKRQRDDLASELDDVFARIDDAFFGVDRDFRFTYVNDRAAELLQHSEEELLGRNVRDVLPDIVGTPAFETFQTALETGEPMESEVYFETLSLWVEANVYPSETGLSVYFRDVTERKERERALRESERRYRTLVENFPSGVVALFDEDFRYITAGGELLDQLEIPSDEPVGSTIYERYPEDILAQIEPHFEAARDGETSSIEVEYHGRHLLADVLPVRGDEEFTGMLVVQDVTERKEREREVARFRRAVEAAGHAIYMTDPDGTITYVNPAFEEMTGYSRTEALGRTPGLLDSGEHSEEYFERLWETISAGERWEEEIVNQRKSGEQYTASQIISPVTDADGDIETFVAIQTDVTERKAYERRLETQVRQQEVVTDLGRQALENAGLDALMGETSKLVAETLDTEYCKVLDLDSGGDELLLRQGIGWEDGTVGEATVSAVEDGSQAAYTLTHEHPIVVEDLTIETRFSGPDLLTSHDVRSGISVVIGPHDKPWGILGVHDTAPREFSEQDVNFVQSVANILASAIDRHDYERQLLHQREELAALNSIHEVVREITSAAIERSTREEIETAVCKHLAQSESYLLAWVGERETSTQTVRSRAEAGTAGYIDDITISLDPDDEHSKGPTARAFRTGETQVTRDVERDPRYEPWRERAKAYGFRSSAAIPIVHENTVYGVLNVYSQRPHAFEARERTVVDQLGEVIGHAIAAAERKRALLSDELVELEFHARDVFDALDEIDGLDEVGALDEIDSLDEDAIAGGTVRFDEAVPTGDGTYLVYGTVTADALETVSAIVEILPHWTDVTFRGEGDERRYELQMADPPLLSALSSVGGTIEEAVIEDGDLRMRFHLSPTADTGRVIDAVQETYPRAEMVARRQIDRPDDTAERLHEVLDETLTDRQRAALRAAYYAGFFEWPRAVQAETVAESLNIAPSTFSQHLRKAEKKVFDALLSSPV